jgi:hypothetical protein
MHTRDSPTDGKSCNRSRVKPELLQARIFISWDGITQLLLLLTQQQLVPRSLEKEREREGEGERAFPGTSTLPLNSGHAIKRSVLVALIYE